MLIKTNQGSPIPIYEQILDGRKFAIAFGAIKPKEQTPSVRKLANLLTVNPNTEVRAYPRPFKRKYLFRAYPKSGLNRNLFAVYFELPD